ncbi:FAD-dependent oxidoreductase [Flexivirga meconopsidis]|uniref:FAD-dependent oxidoreductase n=1 Tax=Flexivirga meconopsidis TaxID=2977121 RepID=UPI00223F3644
MTTRIAIVGGGIAGLTLAAALDPRQFEVVVHEAEPFRAGFGSALGLWSGARRVLRRIGALPSPVDRATQGSLFAVDGRRRARLRAAGPALVDRPALLAALDAAVPASVRRITEEVTDPAALDADLVVGADGVRSRVRGLVQRSAAERIDTGYLTLRGIAPGAPKTTDIGEYWGRGLLAGVAAIPGERTYWFTAHRSELTEPLLAADAVGETRERFADAAPVIRRLLEEAGPETLATRLWVTPPMHRYVRDRYLVIGDAAHAMLPNLGRGACTAIVDAGTLAAALNFGHDLWRWEARRLPATQLARAGSAGVMRLATLAP